MHVLKFLIGIAISFSLSASDRLPIGKKIYESNCISCHHRERIGISGPPLLSESLEKISDVKLAGIIKNGLPNTLMPAHPALSAEDISDVTDYLRTKVNVSWKPSDIKKSIELNSGPIKKIIYKDILNLTAVVERGKSSVWLMEGVDVLDQFPFSDIHGGIKYTKDYKSFFIPTRSGYVGKYDLERGYYGKVRACVSLRNITVSNDSKSLVAACLYPQQLVIMDTKNFAIKKIIKLEGKVSGIYSMIYKNSAIFTYRDFPILAEIDFDTLKLNTKKLNEAVEDFFIDPLDRFIIASSRNGENVSVIQLLDQKVVFEKSISGMPHLSSASFWYDNGQFYFATFHIKSNFISIWKMYDWSFVKKVEVGGNGFFVRSHPKANHLWIDNGSDEVVLFDKKSQEVTKFRPVPGKKFTHTEFSSDGQMAYLSINSNDGHLLIYDTASLKEVKRYDASFPVGKYNVVNKEREFLPILLGESVFTAKCWGCHHQEQLAFGPSFVQIANSRDKNMIRTHLDSPRINAINLGYKNPTMPDIPLTEEEKNILSEYISSFKIKKNIKGVELKLKKMKLYNMAEHSLDHPYRIVSDCKGFLEWSKLGFSVFSDEDKAEEVNYIKMCSTKTKETK